MVGITFGVSYYIWCCYTRVISVGKVIANFFNGLCWENMEYKMWNLKPRRYDEFYTLHR